MHRIPRALRRWPVVVGVVIVVLAGGGAAAWAMARSSGSGTSTTQVVAAKLATINETVSASGTVAAAKEADLDFETSGRVTSVKVQEGDHVGKGQTVATVGTAALRASRDAAQAGVTAAQESVAEASSGAAETAAKSSLVAARSQLESARTALADARLTSTINGTVTTVNLSKGEAVSSSSASAADDDAASASDSDSSSSSSQVVVQSSKRFIVNASVDDTEVKSVKTGQTVAVTPDGATSSVAGVVKSVGAIPSSSSSVVSFPVVIRLTGHPSGVYSGANATVVITTKHTSNVLEIPTFAITYSGSTATVKVKIGSSTSTRTISVGTSYGLETQVLSGLKTGEKVVVAVPTFGRAPTGTGNGGGLGEFGGPSGGSGGFPSGGSGGFSGGLPGGQG